MAAASILLIEDHADSAQVLKRLFEHAGYFVSTGANMAEALRVCEIQKFDVAVADVGLPDGDGRRLLTELREKCGTRGVATARTQ